ncbi:M76 protein [Murid betaherpesvirus 1]|uniref:M76 protein n=1 Tax=Murid herpesvirus 1 TaxID=10366 RepID=H2A2S0_MUHV1|nr:M76 protein [Murid betaherpesvirus 1]
MGTSADTDLLSYLPDARKRAGRRGHLQIYKKITAVFEDDDALNAILGGILPYRGVPGRRYVFYEIDFKKRIPDCIVVLVDDRDGSAECYVIEFKTTMRCADTGTIRSNRTHRLQYLQGLRQLRDSTRIFSQFTVADGVCWKVFPVISFFRQKGARVALTRVFKPREYRVLSSVVLDFLRLHQDESVKNLSRCAVYSGLRGASGKRPGLPPRKTRAPPRRKRAAPAAVRRRPGARRQAPAKGGRRPRVSRKRAAK